MARARAQVQRSSIGFRQTFTIEHPPRALVLGHGVRAGAVGLTAERPHDSTAAGWWDGACSSPPAPRSGGGFAGVDRASESVSGRRTVGTCPAVGWARVATIASAFALSSATSCESGWTGAHATPAVPRTPTQCACPPGENRLERGTKILGVPNAIGVRREARVVGERVEPKDSTEAPPGVASSGPDHDEIPVARAVGLVRGEEGAPGSSRRRLVTAEEVGDDVHGEPGERGFEE